MADSLLAITNGHVYAPHTVYAPGVVLVRNSTIETVGLTREVTIPTDAQIVDAQGQIVAPGLIDLHIHGALGYDAMGYELADVIQALPAFGVTTFLATKLTLPREETVTGLATMAEVLTSPPEGAICAGIHLEGPFLSTERPGMATREWFEPLSWEAFRSLQATTRDAIRMVSFAPEIGDAMDYIPRLLANSVIPSIGHSDASFEDVERAVKLGLNHSTHTFNAMRPMHHRKPGVVGAVLFFDQIVAELIADGLHIHPAVLAIALRAKGLERVALVSDASPLAGLPDGQYEWEHKPVFVSHGSCRLADGTIAGAHALLDTGVLTLIELLNIPLSEALIPATAVPADVLGLNKGRLSPGCDADIVILGADYNPVQTFVAGREVFRRSESK